MPTIAIIGNQSSGKSSVIEAICGVPLPRSTETCTRCPSEVRLIRKSGDWSCRVALRALKDAEGRPLTKIKEEPFGPTILHSAHVQERLYRAQKAVLCPSIPAAWFLDGDVEKEDAPKNLFSDTTICITITGPDCINLSFIDLPGELTAQVSLRQQQIVPHPRTTFQLSPLLTSLGRQVSLRMSTKANHLPTSSSCRT